MQLNFFKKNLIISSSDNEQAFKINLHKKIIPINYYQYCQAFQISNITKKHIYKVLKNYFIIFLREF